MNKTLNLEPISEEELQAKAGVEYYFAEIKRLNEQMQADDQKESSQQQVETRKSTAQIKTTMQTTMAALGMDLSEGLTVLEERRVRENERHERELTALRLEKEGLKSEVRLRAGQPKDKDAE